jgi:hypothetical protein
MSRSAAERTRGNGESGNARTEFSGLARIGDLIRRLEHDCARAIRSAQRLQAAVRREARRRRSAADLRITWVASLKQWRKRRNVSGKTKTFYLGTGESKDDHESYAAAVQKWKAILRDLKRGGAASACPAERAAKKPAQKRLGSHIDDYIADQRRRYDHGLKFPTAPQSERISGARFMAYRYNANLIKDEWDDEPVPQDEAGMTALMRRFRDNQRDKMGEGGIQPGTMNERMKSLRHVVKWLHEHYVIPALPRQMRAMCCKYAVPPSARSLDLDTIHAIWKSASARFKTYMALALNCGFYVTDIAHLERSAIQGDHLLCDRHKTRVPTRFKLWPVTRQLLAENCNGVEPLAFAARRGGSLLVIDPDANGGVGRRWCEIESDLQAIKKRLGIGTLGFSMFRDTSSTLIEGIDKTLTDTFDGHKDGRMARFYLDGQKLDLDRVFARLDVATDELGRIYNLPLPVGGRRGDASF